MLAVITYPDRHEEITVPRSRPNNFLKKLLNSIYVWTRNNILIPIPAVYPETISLEDQQAILEGPIKVIYIDGDRDIVMVINGDEGAMRNLPINALASDRCLAFAQTHPEKYFMSRWIIRGNLITGTMKELLDEQQLRNFWKLGRNTFGHNTYRADYASNLIENTP